MSGEEPKNPAKSGSDNNVGESTINPNNSPIEMYKYLYSL